eukprot:sb/3478017/
MHDFGSSCAFQSAIDSANLTVPQAPKVHVSMESNQTTYQLYRITYQCPIRSRCGNWYMPDHMAGKSGGRWSINYVSGGRAVPPKRVEFIFPMSTMKIKLKHQVT